MRYSRRRGSRRHARPLTFEDEAFCRHRAAVATPRFRQLYRRWLTDGDSVFEPLSSSVIATALERGTGRIECHVLVLSYPISLPWSASSVRRERGRGRRHTLRTASTPSIGIAVDAR